MTREDINDIINAICPDDEDYEKPCISPKYLRQELEQLALDQRQWNDEPTTKNNLGVDCVSRQAVLDAFGLSERTRKYGGDHSGYDTMMLYEIQDTIESIPSVNPQEPKTGHWIDDKCTNCGYEVEPWNNTNYCPNCGAKMESEVDNGND